MRCSRSHALERRPGARRCRTLWEDTTVHATRASRDARVARLPASPRGRAPAQCTRTWIGPYVFVTLSARNRTDTKSEPSVPDDAVGVTSFQNGSSGTG